MSEHVLVVPTRAFQACGSFEGIQTHDIGRYQRLLFTPDHFSYLPRAAAEENTHFKQIIPYCVFMHAGKVFNYFRTKKSGEERLRGKRSVGVGGHIASTDQLDYTKGGFAFYHDAMMREIAEEVPGMDAVESESLLGLVNEDKTPVGKVHLGIVHVFQVRRLAQIVTEDALTGAQFSELPELLAHIDEFELWSMFVINQLAIEFSLSQAGKM